MRGRNSRVGPCFKWLGELLDTVDIIVVPSGSEELVAEEFLECDLDAVDIITVPSGHLVLRF